MALGFFDGVHKGHQQVIRSAVLLAEEKGFKSAVMTFDPHPSVVLSQKHNQVHYITPLEAKLKLIEQLGVDFVYVIRFTSAFAGLEPQEFIDRYVIALNVQHAVAGFDYTYGKFGKGTMETMTEHSKGHFGVTTVPMHTDSGGKVSSTAIRRALQDGEVQLASRLLGRFYSAEGTVVHGEKRGRTIGFPTANVRLDADYMIPAPGVYAVSIHVVGSWHAGVCNVGYKPTFNKPGESSLSIEVHVFDFEKSIYGERVAIEWHRRIRSEQKFSGIEELKSQIAKDKQTALDYFHSIQD